MNASVELEEELFTAATALPPQERNRYLQRACGGDQQLRERVDTLLAAFDPVSATIGVVTSEQLDLRPVLRTGELLEVVPWLIVTQHGGGGKAHQYFLRGFNLGHGTDLATSVDGVPVNMPTHAHGQGYTDIRRRVGC